MGKRVKVDRRPMTPDERVMARAISPMNVTYLPGIGTKRFAREMAALAEHEDAAITEAQAVYLRQVVHRFRRQVPSAVVSLAAGGAQ